MGVLKGVKKVRKTGRSGNLIGGASNYIPRLHSSCEPSSITSAISFLVPPPHTHTFHNFHMSTHTSAPASMVFQPRATEHMAAVVLSSPPFTHTCVGLCGPVYGVYT